jgi:hypothetical protein
MIAISLSIGEYSVVKRVGICNGEEDNGSSEA